MPSLLLLNDPNDHLLGPAVQVQSIPLSPSRKIDSNASSWPMNLQNS